MCDRAIDKWGEKHMSERGRIFKGTKRKATLTNLTGIPC